MPDHKDLQKKRKRKRESTTSVLPGRARAHFTSSTQRPWIADRSKGETGALAKPFQLENYFVCLIYHIFACVSVSILGQGRVKVQPSYLASSQSMDRRHQHTQLLPSHPPTKAKSAQQKKALIHRHPKPKHPFFSHHAYL